MSLLHFSRWKTFAILGAVFLGLLFALPNVLGSNVRDKLPTFMQSTINLGLDLQGGAHMLLEVDTSSVTANELVSQKGNMQQALRDKQVKFAPVKVVGEKVIAEIRSAEDSDRALAALKVLESPIDASKIGGGKTVRIEKVSETRFELTITEENIQAIKDRTIEQSIEVLRRRIDPQGTTEMTLAKEGSDRILLQVPGAKNVDDIKKRINETANLSFNMVSPQSFSQAAMIAARDKGITPPGTILYPEENGGYLLVEERTRITGECLKSAKEGLHPEKNSPIINFEFNLRCAREFGKLTAENVGRQFAVVLEMSDTGKQIITAPRINGPITGGKGFIEGSFTMESARELSLLFNAGALPAKLDIVEERTVGADLGADAIRAGKIASIIGLTGVALFMWLSYGLRFGSIANMALATNIVLIAGVLSLLGSTLTLPGIAGIILTIGMAVDANVLIFERIREEAHNGRPPVNAIETGYRRSFAPILDANITTLIAAVTLYFVGSGPVRGFAVTLAIGIVMSVFTAVIFARLLTATWLRGTRPKTLPI